MGMGSAIARTIRRLNLHGIVMALPVFGEALYQALSLELERVDDYRKIVRNSAVPNVEMDANTLDDYEQKYGINTDITATDDERIARIVERAQFNGSGGVDWLQDQISKAGFNLYIIENTKDETNLSQFGDFQFGDTQFGGLITYSDPRLVGGEIVASSPNGNIGGQYFGFGDYQFSESIQFGTLQANTAYPRPAVFSIGSNPLQWGYCFFLSPFKDRLATSEDEFLNISESEWAYLRKLLLQLKHLRNWAIVQITIGSPPPQIMQYMVDDVGNQLIDDNGAFLFYYEDEVI